MGMGDSGTHEQETSIEVGGGVACCSKWPDV
jgi:hypothetical protein